MKPPKKSSSCLCCGGRTHERYRVGVALDLLADNELRDIAGDWLLADLLGYCSIRCARQVTVAPLVSRLMFTGGA